MILTVRGQQDQGGSSIVALDFRGSANKTPPKIAHNQFSEFWIHPFKLVSTYRTYLARGLHNTNCQNINNDALDRYAPLPPDGKTRHGI